MASVSHEITAWHTTSLFARAATISVPSRFSSSKAVSQTKKDLPEMFLMRETYERSNFLSQTFPLRVIIKSYYRSA